jgi:hypothetical protein
MEVGLIWMEGKESTETKTIMKILNERRLGFTLTEGKFKTYEKISELLSTTLV